jgi:N-glycosylase/DNA lyase
LTTLLLTEKVRIALSILQFIVDDFSLHHTLGSGQTFCWKKLSPESSGSWKGYIYDIPCLARQAGNILILESPLELPEPLARQYFNLHPSWAEVLNSLPDEGWLNQARKEVSGLRCLHEPWWECTVNFICSSLKQIPQIEQINQNLRKTFGEPIVGTDAYRFPTAQTLAQVSEEELRSCKLGYRARHLSRAAHQVTQGSILWESLSALSLTEASDQLQTLAGVGEKVAHCILLYAGNRYDAFPLDVWVFRLMHELYFPKHRQLPPRKLLHQKSMQLFGSHRGIAQHFLFHWYRNRPDSAKNLSEKTK